MNIHSSLVRELKDKNYRAAWVASQIAVGLPFQIRALRNSRGLNQQQLAEKASMSQPRIAELEKPGARRCNVETLLRVASALDVALEVRFVPFSVLIKNTEEFDPDHAPILSFSDELHAEEERVARRATLVVAGNAQAQPAAAPVLNAESFADLILPSSALYDAPRYRGLASRQAWDVATYANEYQRTRPAPPAIASSPTANSVYSLPLEKPLYDDFH